MDRKTFIKDVFRFSLIGGLAFLTGFIALRRNISVSNACRQEGTCGGCPVLAECSRPEALKHKKSG